MSERSDEATQVFFIITNLFVWLGAVVIVKPKMEALTLSMAELDTADASLKEAAGNLKVCQDKLED